MINETLIKVLGFAIFPALALVVGSCIALIREPGPKLRSAIQHFSAGVIFCVLATELLPDLLHRRMPVMTIIGFSLGVLTMLLMKYWAEKKASSKTSTGRPSSFIVAMGIDIILDGLLIGLGFAAGQKQGLLLTIAMVLEVLFLGVSCAASMSRDKTSRIKIVRTTSILGGFLLIGASFGAFALTWLSAMALDALLAFGVAALLYLVTEELLVEAHETEETPFQTAMFFVGFIVLFTVDMLIK